MATRSPLRVTLTLEGELVIDRVLQGIASRASAPLSNPEVIAGVLTAFRRITGAAFASEGTSTGAAWAPLAKSTQAERKRLGFPPAHPILQRTGKLQRALTLGEGAHVSTGPQRLAYQLSGEVGYFRFHQSRRARTRLPRRAPVLLTADDRTALMHPIRLYLTGRPVNAPRRARVG